MTKEENMSTPKKPDWIALSENDKPSKARRMNRTVPALVLLLAISGAGVSVLATEFGDESNADVAIENIAVDENVTVPEPVPGEIAKAESSPKAGALTPTLANPSVTTLPTAYYEDDYEDDYDYYDDDYDDDDD